MASRTIDVLLELTELAPVEQIEVMLEPQVLVDLLDTFGHPREETKRRLASGTLPGELLRDLLKEHGAAAVWERVPPSAQRGMREPKKPRRGILGRLETKERSRAERWTSVAGLCALIWSGMWMAGAFPEWGRGPSLGTTIASCLGGAAIFGPLTVPRSAGMIGGFLAGAANVLAAWLWLTHFPEIRVGRLAVLAIVLLPLLLGLLFSWLFERLFAVTRPRGF
ncbi:MAG: hypothetical protein H6721_15630 [Sandaracinus sp.]|nr:hypothetical protein [Sandaracinus sp.]MCB9618075.1 hypothetical protein [Sandaracinus sp.]MCB9624093.1 hypothetical protein [Sandaracinus sp.]MCB9633547.1 hypothetical protein [Sandaracinus sp.]